MTHPSPAGRFGRLVTVIVLLTLSLVCISLLFAWFWRDNAFPAEKKIARNIELASFGPDLQNKHLDYCIPRPGLPACTSDLLQNAAPGTPCYLQRCSWGHVTDLSLYGGQLEELPVEIAGLPGLAVLNLHNNHLTSLPPEIGRLSSLTELNLAGNQLTSLPPEIGRLTNLKKLDLSGNRLTSLPPEIGRLTNLTYLNLGNNPIQGPLPEFLINLPLAELVYSETGLCVPVDQDFQHWIGSVSTVNRKPSPHPNDVCALAAEDQQAMRALLELPGHPADWDLNKLPCTWSRVSCDTAGHVIQLDLYAIPMAQIPPEFWQLSHLQSLNLANVQLPALPPDIQKLTSLARLNLAGNRLTRLPPEIGQLGSLTELDLSSNMLVSLPPEIGRLQNLSSLNLHGNRLASLPVEVSELSSLALLDVSGNPLSGPLPAFLAQLANVSFVFSNTNLCVPQNDEILAWLGRQSKGIYTASASGAMVYNPPDPEALIRAYLEQHGCR